VYELLADDEQSKMYILFSEDASSLEIP
jgi:hypothetical protein